MRPFLFVLSAYAVSLAALGAASTTAWVRCGDGSDCSAELAFATVALAPAALLLCIMLLSLRRSASNSAQRRILLSLTVGVSVAPLIAFILQDPVIVLISIALVAVLVFSAIDQEPPARERAGGDGRTSERGRAAAASAGDGLTVRDERIDVMTVVRASRVTRTSAAAFPADGATWPHEEPMPSEERARAAETSPAPIEGVRRLDESVARLESAGHRLDGAIERLDVRLSRDALAAPNRRHYETFTAPDRRGPARQRG